MKSTSSASSVGELKSLTVAEEGMELEDSWIDSGSSCCFWIANSFPLGRPRVDLRGVGRSFAGTGDRSDGVFERLDGVFDLVVSV